MSSTPWIFQALIEGRDEEIVTHFTPTEATTRDDWFSVGIAHERLDHFPEAVECYRHCFPDASSYVRTVICYIQWTGKVLDQELEECYATPVRYWQIWFDLAVALQLHHHLEGYYVFMKRAYELNPSRLVVNYCNACGYVGRWEEVIDCGTPRYEAVVGKMEWKLWMIQLGLMLMNAHEQLHQWEEMRQYAEGLWPVAVEWWGESHTTSLELACRMCGIEELSKLTTTHPQLQSFINRRLNGERRESESRVRTDVYIDHGGRRSPGI